MFSSDVLNEGSTINPQAKFGRKESFIKSTIVKEGVLLDLVKSTYDDRKSNSGNTSNNHRSATNGEVASVNNQLISLVPTRRPEPPGGYFWVQHKGKAGKDKDDNHSRWYILPRVQSWAMVVGTRLISMVGQ